MNGLQKYGLPVKRWVGKSVFLACRYFDLGKCKLRFHRPLGSLFQR
jgi:hypothetical protein